MDQSTRNRAYQIIERVLMNGIQPKDENMLNESSMKILKDLEFWIEFQKWSDDGGLGNIEVGVDEILKHQLKKFSMNAIE